MYITQESDYAVRIVYCLAKCGCRRDARNISEEMCVSLRFSLKILGKLVNSGILASYKGNRGGYELAHAPQKISLLDVITAVEGPYRLSRCIGNDGASGCNRGSVDSCVFRGVFDDISREINARIDAVSFADLLARAHAAGDACTD